LTPQIPAQLSRQSTPARRKVNELVVNGR